VDFHGFDEDLNEAMKIAVRETVNFLAEQKMVPMSRERSHIHLLRWSRLPRLPGGGYPQRRALHDPQVNFHEQVAISCLLESEEISLVARCRR